MIDIHSHILHGLDDGSKSIEEALDLAKHFEQQGVRHAIATPHHNVRDWQNPKSVILPKVDQLNHELKEQNIDLNVYSGQEIRISGDITDQIDRDDILFVGQGQNYLLIEFPNQSVPAYASQVFNQLYEREIIPIIAHPERNHDIMEKPDVLYDLVSAGALAQLTASSYTGDLGNKLEKFSKQLIDANLVHIIASDAHNVHTRPSHLADAYAKLEKEYDYDTRFQFESVSNRILNGEFVQPPTPEHVKKKRFFGLF